MPKPFKKELQLFHKTALGLGLVQGPHLGVLSGFSVAYSPYVTSQAYYDLTEKASLAWSKLLCLASQDRSLIYRIFENLVQCDPYLKELMKLYLVRAKPEEDLGFASVRCDFINNCYGQPKFCGCNQSFDLLMYQSQVVSEAKRLTDLAKRDKYVENRPHDALCQAIVNIFKAKRYSGTGLLIDGPELNSYWVTQVAIDLMRAGIKTAIINVSEAQQSLKVRSKGQLAWQDDEVSFVLMTSSSLRYTNRQEFKRIWKVRHLVERSRVFRVPSASLQLACTNRMQVQLSKPQIYRKYLSQKELSFVQKTVISSYAFDGLPDHKLKVLLDRVFANQGLYMLKPSFQGHRKHIYGIEVINTLRKLGPEQRKAYIVQSTIPSIPERQLIIRINRLQKKASLSESSKQFRKTMDECQTQRLINGLQYREVVCSKTMSFFSLCHTQKCQILKSQVSGHMMLLRPLSLSDKDSS